MDVWKRILLIISSICLFVSISDANMKGLLIAIISGVTYGVLLCVLEKRTANKWIHIGSGVIAVGVFFIEVKSFVLTWQMSGKAQVIAELLQINKELLLAIFGGVLAGISVVCIYLTFEKLLAWIIDAVRVIKYKEIVNDLFHYQTKYFFGNAILAIIIVAISAIVGVGTLTLAYTIPSEVVENNITSSAKIISREGIFPSLSGLCTSQLDNFTDSIMLLEAGDNTDDTLLHRAMLSYRTEYADTTPFETLVRKYVDGEAADEVVNYPRYWHGYLILLKPLLAIMDYNGIRVLNGIIQLGLVLITSILLIRNNKKVYVLPYLFSYLMLMPFALAKSIQFSACFYVFSICFILFLKLGRKKKIDWIIFLIAGILTAFFDLLTYPIATFGMIAVIYLISREDFSIENTIVRIVKYSFAWAFGYGMMWISKWIIASLVTDANVIANALGAFAERSSHVGEDGVTSISLLAVEMTNVQTFLYTPVTLLMVIFVVYYICRIKRKRIAVEMDKLIYQISIPYVVIAFAPMVWYVFAANHSSIHYWFTNKACVVTFFSIMCMLVNIDLKIGEHK